MRTLLFFAVLFAMFIFTIVAAYKPSLIETEYDKIKAPISSHFAERDAEIWRLAKQHEWATWSKNMKLPADCAKPRSAMRELECKNFLQEQSEAFERTWNEKVSGGWKPDGAD